MAATYTSEAREVVVFSGEHPNYADFSTSHRGELRKNTKRAEFSIHDPDAGVTYHAVYNEVPSGPSSPRHHHDFEQFRFILGGEAQYGQRSFTAGWLGYFGEGVFYGPQAQDGPGRSIVLQFPGPTGAPFHSREQSRRAQREMLAEGAKFEGGLVLWPDGRREDGADALHRQINGTPIEYPPARYAEQVWMDSNAYTWQSTPLPGVAVKRLAMFNDRGPAVQLIRLDAGAELPAGQASSIMTRFIYEGEAEYNGQALPAISNLYYPPGTTYEALRSPSGALIMSFELQAQLPGSEPPLPYRL